MILIFTYNANVEPILITNKETVLVVVDGLIGTQWLNQSQFSIFTSITHKLEKNTKLRFISLISSQRDRKYQNTLY